MDRKTLINTQNQLASAHEEERAQHLVNAAIQRSLGHEDQALSSEEAAKSCENSAAVRRAVVAELQSSDAKVTAEQIEEAGVKAVRKVNPE